MRLHLHIFLLFVLVAGKVSAQDCLHSVAYHDPVTDNLLETRADSVCWEYVNKCDTTLYLLKDGDTTASFPIIGIELTDSSFILDIVQEFGVVVRGEFFDEDRIVVTSPSWGFYMVETAKWNICLPTTIEQIHGKKTPEPGTLMIVHAAYDAKGFVMDEDKAELPCASLAKNPDVRLFIEPLENDLFEVHYKYRSSLDFLTDTVRLYVVNEFAFVALKPERFPAPDDDFLITWCFPASTDERDVVRACRTAEGKLVYIF